MNSPDKALEQLRSLMEAASKTRDIYTQVAAGRAMIALYRKFPEDVQGERFRKNVAKIEESIRALSNMLGLALGQSWDSHIHSVKWWAKRSARKQREDWINLQRRTLKMRAVARVHEILLESYPDAMNHREMGRIFTKYDLVQMGDSFSGFSR